MQLVLTLQECHLNAHRSVDRSDCPSGGADCTGRMSSAVEKTKPQFIHRKAFENRVGAADNRQHDTWHMELNTSEGERLNAQIDAQTKQRSRLPVEK
jgi:hypothetical protein